jgi:hypothetical protein
MRTGLGPVCLALALAGCVSPSLLGAGGPAADAGAILACVASRCDLPATTSPATRQANELSVAVNPLDPQNIIATGKDYTPDEAGDCVWAGVYATKDGGLTWKDQNVPGSPWKHEKDPTTPVTPFTKYWCATDPVVRFGPDGTAYWVVQPYQCDPVSGSKLGRGVVPKGGANDWLYTCSSLWVLVSHDGGMTWPVGEARELGAGAGGLPHDKPWLAVSPDGAKVLVCWDYGGPESTTTAGAPYTPLDGRGGVVCSVSKDKGASWSRFAIATTRGGSAYVDFDASGRAWMSVTTGDREGSILVLSSEDGAAWSSPVEAAKWVEPKASTEYGWPVLNGSAFRLSEYGMIAVDRTTGPHAGSLYITYFDYARGNGDTMLVASHDVGKTWTPPVRVNDDGGGADQFLPAVSVGPDGTVDVSWLDRRDDPANHVYDAYYAYSLDGGASFSKNLRVSSASSDEKHSHHQNGMVFLGDYRDMGSMMGRATMVWVDTRDAKADVYVASILRPPAVPG